MQKTWCKSVGKPSGFIEGSESFPCTSHGLATWCRVLPDCADVIIIICLVGTQFKNMHEVWPYRAMRALLIYFHFFLSKGISNSVLPQPWAKVEKGKDLFEKIVDKVNDKDEIIEALFNMMRYRVSINLMRLFTRGKNRLTLDLDLFFL